MHKGNSDFSRDKHSSTNMYLLSAVNTMNQPYHNLLCVSVCLDTLQLIESQTVNYQCSSVCIYLFTIIGYHCVKILNQQMCDCTCNVFHVLKFVSAAVYISFTIVVA